MKRPVYKIKLESDYYESLEETSEGLLIIWEDDFGGQKIKIEKKRQQTQEDSDGE